MATPVAALYGQLVTAIVQQDIAGIHAVMAHQPPIAASELKKIGDAARAVTYAATQLASPDTQVVLARYGLVPAVAPAAAPKRRRTAAADADPLDA